MGFDISKFAATMTPVSDSDTIPPECVDCIRDCAWCTYNIADPETYHRR